jgi:hypothetical protein
MTTQAQAARSTDFRRNVTAKGTVAVTHGEASGPQLSLRPPMDDRVSLAHGPRSPGHVGPCGECDLSRHARPTCCPKEASTELKSRGRLTDANGSEPGRSDPATPCRLPATAFCGHRLGPGAN